VRQDVLLSDSPGELLQRFRVPEPVELRWIELASALPAHPSSIPGLVKSWMAQARHTDPAHAGSAREAA